MIPTGVTIIGNYAFFLCTGLTSLTIPDSVTMIGKSSFYKCSGLTDLAIPESMSSIGDSAFAFCSGLASVSVPDSVISIGNYAFRDCTGLTNAIIGNNVTSIGTWAFLNCTGLTSVTIPASVTNIGGSLFYKCSSLTAINVDETNSSYSSLDGVLFNKTQTTLIECPTAKTGDYTIPYSVTMIEAHAFSNCDSIESVIIPDSVTVIGNYAFQSCSGLTSVYFKGNAPVYGSEVFSGASNATVYYLASTTGWGTTYAGRPTSTYNLVELTVTGGTGSGSYAYTEQVAIAADTPVPGKTFDQWVGDTQYVSSVTSSSAIVTIPSEDVAMVATYKDIYCALVVVSEYGLPIPNLGTNTYVWGSAVTCAVAAVASEGLTNWICTGWTGTGSVPSSGTLHTTGSIVLTNLASTITWNWPVKTVSDLLVKNVGAVQRPGTKLVDVNYDLLIGTTNTAEVALTVLDGAEAVSASTAYGAVGAGLSSGMGKTIKGVST